MITGFPSIRIYRKGSDDVVVSGRHMHEAYKGDRTEEALKAFVDKLVPSAGSARTRMTETRQLTLGEGCMVRFEKSFDESIRPSPPPPCGPSGQQPCTAPPVTTLQPKPSWAARARHPDPLHGANSSVLRFHVHAPR